MTLTQELVQIALQKDNWSKLSKVEKQSIVEWMEEQEKYKLENDFAYYIRKSWSIIEPGIDYMHNWHIDAIAEYLQAVNDGEIKRLIINMPPRYMKSIAVTVDFPTWVWTKNPFKRFISVSYSASLSKKHNMNKRDIIQSPWYQGLWKDSYYLKDDKNTQQVFENDKMGFMFSTSIGGTLTGEGGDIIIVDDPHNPQQAESDAERETAIEFCKTTLPTRLNDKKKGAIIVVMQRLHEQDVSGYFLKQGGWEHLCLQGVAEKKTIIVMPKSLKQIVREEKAYLWPEREGKEEIEAMEKALGSYGFSGQYQQSPSPAAGGMLKRYWYKYWKPKGVDLPPVTIKNKKGEIEYVEAVELPDYWDEQIQSWDCTFKDLEDNDYVCGGVIGRRLENYFLLDLINEKLDLPATIKAILNMSNKWPKALAKYIEDKANGPAVISLLRNKCPGLIAVNPQGGKIARAAAVSPAIESGNFYIPHPMLYTWVEEYLGQSTKFPKGVNDDMVDMTTQGLNKLIYRDFDTQEEPQKPDAHWMFHNPEPITNDYMDW